MTLPANWVDGGAPFHAVNQDNVENAVNSLTNTAVVGSANGTPTKLTLWVGSAAQYAAISSKDPNTVYMVTS